MEGEGNEGGQGFGKVFEVLGETPVASESGESALDNPAARQDDEALHVVAPLDDLRAQRRHLCHRSVNLPGVVAAIGPDQFEPREAPAYLVEDEPGPSRSWIAAEWTTTRIGSPSVSTRAWILRPFTCLPAS